MFAAEWKRLWKHRAVRILVMCFVIGTLVQNGIITFSSDVMKLQEEVCTMRQTDLQNETAVQAAYESMNYDTEIIERTEYVRCFSDHIQEQLEEVQQKQKSVLFSSEENQKRLKKEEEILEKLQNAAPELLNDLPFKKQLEAQKYWSAVYLLIGLYLVYIVMQQDRESGVLPLYGSTAVSSAGTAVSKTAVLLVMMVLLYGVKELADLFYLWLCGIPLQAPVQRIPGYDHVHLYQTVLQYHVFLHAQKVIAVFLIMMLFTVLCSAMNSISASLSVITLILTAEFIGAKLISAASPYHALKTINLFTLLSQSKFNDEIMLFAKRAVPEAEMILMFSAVLMIVFTVLSTVLYCRSFHRSMRSFRKPAIRSSSLVRYQLYELMTAGKAALIIIAIVAYNVISIRNYSAVSSAKEQSYQTFRKQYYGRITDILVERISKDEEEILSAYEEMNRDYQEWIQEGGQLTEEQLDILDELQAKAVNRENIQRVAADVEQLQAVGAEWYTDQDTLELLVNKNSRFEVQLEFLMAVVPLIVIIFSVMSPFYQSGRYRLAFSSRTGKKGYLGRERILFTITGILLMVIACGAHAYKILTNYTYTFMNVSVNVLGIRSSIPLILWYALLWVNRLLILQMIVSMSMKLSERMGTTTGSAVMIMITAVLTISPVGSMSMLRYDYLNHPVNYAVMILLCIAMTAGSIVNIRRAHLEKSQS